MRAARLLLGTGALLLLLTLIPAPLSPSQGARAWHAGPVECGTGTSPVSDGAISPGEYGENYFDGTTKLLAYFSCVTSAQPLLRVGLVTPWPGWAGLLLQASDGSADLFNEVRFAYDASTGTPEVVDGYRNLSEALPTPDLSLGGSSDVFDLTTGEAGAARIFEFTIPLRSADRYDSQLQASGPYSFGLAYNAFHADLASEATGMSDLHPIVFESAATPGGWTSVEFAVPSSSPALAEPTMFVVLRDSSGYPVPSTQLEIFVQTAFGFYDVGPVVTNLQGVAEVSYVPRDSGTYVLGATYTGGYGLLASVTWRTLEVGPASGDGTIGLGPAEGGGLGLRPIDALIAVVVIGVWATYTYAFFITRRAMRADRSHPGGDELRLFKWRSGK